MGYLSCRAESSISTCRSISSLTPSPYRKAHRPHHQRRKKEEEDPTAEPRASPPSHQDAEDDGGDPAGRSPHNNIRHFTYRELESATHNFSDDALLGRGSHGAVYKAVLRGGRPVAVKRPSRRPALARDEVENEIDILSRIRSPCLVNLIGFTPPSSSLNSNSTRRERLMVVEFMPNGTLYDLLHSNTRPPGWSRRLRLALQTARALLTLHSSTPPVIHRDVKSANILIDHHFNARLCDFGLALRHNDDAAAGFSSARSTPPAGTLGYLDPSYVTPDSLSTKTDVFSFGILLLEIMSGRKAIDVGHSPPSVVEWAVPLLKRGKVSSLYDPRIAPPRVPAAKRQLASLAASCVRSCKERRPSMEEVVEQLKILSKTVPARPWNGLSVVNPCSVVETERTLTRLNSNSLNVDLSSSPRCRVVEETSTVEEEVPIGMRKPPSSANTVRPLRNANKVFSVASTRGGRNLMDLMSRPDQDVVGVMAVEVDRRQRSSISRARSLHVARDYYDRNGLLLMRRNQSVKGGTNKPFSRLNGLEALDGDLHDRAGDVL